MGGTLPLLLDGLIDRDRDVGTRSAALCTNVLGAAVGWPRATGRSPTSA
jgi:hypothetical protein